MVKETMNKWWRIISKQIKRGVNKENRKYSKKGRLQS